MSDADLVRALTERRPEAFRTAWERFSPLVEGVLRHALGSDEVEDVRQEVFCSLFRRVDTLRDPLALRPFILAITLNTITCERRRRRRRGRVALTSNPAEDAASDCAGPPESFAFARFVRLIRRLGARERASFVLRFIEGMTVAQIAQALNVSAPTARRSFCRAWTSMQKWAERDPYLNDYFHGSRPRLPLGDSAGDDEAYDLSARYQEIAVAEARKAG